MITLKDFVKDKDFASGESDADPFPEGKTELDVPSVEVEEKEIEFDNGKKTRYILSFGEKRYWAGPQIMDGIKQALGAGFSKLVVTRKGQGLKTKYTVMPVQEPSQKGDV